MSVLRINQNPVAINSLRNLKITGMAIAKTLEKLSSGLRINRAADDAAGLSISEKLRSQIRGLNRASSNALDGISLIQTAEGALNEVHSILQRVRELAVQAANGIYTAGDRAAIQLEVSQLVDEINRISKTTEFNTKTLLDGTLGALISTDDYTKVRAAVVGNVGKGGNFVMQAVAKTTGQLQVQKTDVFTTELETDAVGKINYLHTLRADATVTSAGVDGVGNTGLVQIEVPITANGSTAVQSTTDATFTIYSAAGALDAVALSGTFQANELTSGDKVLITLQTAASVVTLSVALAPADTLATVANNISTALGSYVSIVSFADAVGEHYFSINFSAATTSVLNSEFVDVDGSGSDFYFSLSSAGLSNRFFDDLQYNFANNGATLAASTLTAATGPLTIGNAGTGQVEVKLDTRFNFTAVASFGAAAGAVTAADTIAWDRYSGGNALQDYGNVWQVGAVPSNGTFMVSAITSRTYAVFEFDNAAYTSLVAGGTDQNIATAAARGSQINSSTGSATASVGATYAGSIGTALENVRIAFDGILQIGETATFNMSTSNVLTGDQLNTLASLSRFQEFGVFNGRKNVEMTIFLRGSESQATVNISESDTFEDLAGKISLAIWNADGTGVVNSGILNTGQLPDLVHINTIGQAKGTMSITTPIPGAEIVFSGDESLLKALSLIEILEAKSPIYSVSAFDIERNVAVGSTTTDTNEVNGLLPGLRVFFDNTLGMRLDAQPPVSLAGGSNTLNSFGYAMAFERPAISLSSVAESFFIHVAPRDFSLQIGANQGQTISSFIADTSAEALGVEGLLVVTGELAQEAISIVDVAINRVSDQRSRLGAIQNRLESTIRNLDVAAENLTASESRIRDVDVAMATMQMTRNSILLQAGTAAMAQANALPQAVLQLLR